MPFYGGEKIHDTVFEKVKVPVLSKLSIIQLIKSNIQLEMQILTQ